MKALVFVVLVSYCLAAGQWVQVDWESNEVHDAARYATEALSAQTNSPYHTKLDRIHQAAQQVVAGMNYKISMSVGYTSCKKKEVDYSKIDDCEFLDENSFKVCDVTVYKDLSKNYKLTGFMCGFHIAAGQKRTKWDVYQVERGMFADFIAKYNKDYGSEEEKDRRFTIFRENLKNINLYNEVERGTAKYGVTRFTDLTEEEFKKQALGFRPDLLNTDDPLPQAGIPTDPIPDSFDWRTKGVVTEVKDQGQCGSCWAFSTTGNIEGQWTLKKKKLVSLSEQELVDCDKVDQGCEGGLPSNAYKEIIRLGGLEGEKDYPYDGEDEKCNLNKTDVRVYINSSLAISQNETEMAAWLVKNGPISIGINANAMQFYYGGISHPWKFLCNPDNLDHGVLIVGYGVHTYPLFKKTLPFWIIKNSWGPSWGEQGYYRVYRGDGTCGLNLMATSAVVD